MNDPKQNGRQLVESVVELATAPVRRLVYSTPQLVLASPFSIIEPGEVVRTVTRRLLQTGGGIPG